MEAAWLEFISAFVFHKAFSIDENPRRFKSIYLEEERGPAQNVDQPAKECRKARSTTLPVKWRVCETKQRCKK